MPACQECGTTRPLVYTDHVNRRFVCGPCHAEIVDGKRTPKERKMSTTETFDFADAQSSALVATDGAKELAPTILAFRVTDEPSREHAISLARGFKEMRERLEDERDAGTKPLLGVVDRIRGWFRRPIEDFAAMEKHLKAEVGRYRDELAERQRKALTEAQSHVEVERAVAVLTPKVAGEGSRTTWKAEVVTHPSATFAAIEALVAALPPSEIAAALADALSNRLPDAYIAIDQVLLNKQAVAMKEKFNVPGAKAVKTTAVVLK